MLRFIGIYNYTVVLTYCSLLSAVIGIALSAKEKFTAAVICLVLCGICDAFDGTIARSKKDRTEDEKAFGIQIDSLSDFMAFGVLPAGILFSTWSNDCGLEGWRLPVAAGASAFIALTALIRLAYFNVVEEIRQKESQGKRRTEFEGMPVTTMALILPAVYMFKFLLEPLQGGLTAYILTAVIVISGFLFISRIRFGKPGGRGMIIMGVIGALELAFILFGESIITGVMSR